MEQIDKKVQELFDVVLKKKQEIAKLEKPNYITNMSITMEGNTYNLHTVDVIKLIEVLAYLSVKQTSFEEIAYSLNLKVKFKYGGFTYSDWESDIKQKIDILQINVRKKELNELESRLGSLISPELKRQMELQEIEKLLNK